MSSFDLTVTTTLQPKNLDFSEMGCCCSKPVDGCFSCFSEPDERPAEASSKLVDESPVKASFKAVDERPSKASSKAVDERPVKASSKLVDEPPVKASFKPVDERPAEASSKAVDEPPVKASSKAVDEHPAKASSKAVDEPSTGTPSASKRETQQGKEQPKGKVPSPSKFQRAREAAILVLDFTSTIADASEILKPIKVVSDCIKKTLEVTKVGFNLPDETSLFTKSHSACRR